jgi:hypothetical protein
MTLDELIAQLEVVRERWGAGSWPVLAEGDAGYYNPVASAFIQMKGGAPFVVISPKD